MLTVLLVDDSSTSRFRTRMWLNNNPLVMCIHEASCGDDGLQKALRLKPDVVFMDIMMPGMNGIECCRRIKAALGRVKIYMVTSENTFCHMDKAFKAGCDGYIRKPVEGDVIQEKLDSASRLLALEDKATMLRKRSDT